jgi:hypothetical protein
MIKHVMEHPVLNRLSFFILGLSALALSIMAWTLILDFARKPNIEILAWSIPGGIAMKGGEFTAIAKYRKHDDCPGQWTIRAIAESDGTLYQIESGRIGTRPPGDFTLTHKFTLPPIMPAGEYTVSEVIDGICDDGLTFVSRGPHAHLRVIN